MGNSIVNLAIRLKRHLDKSKREEILDRYFRNDINRCDAVRKGLTTEKSITLFCGNIIDFDGGICSYLTNLSAMLTDEEIVLLSESVINDAKERIGLQVIPVPAFWGRYYGQYKTETNVVCTRKMVKEIRNNETLWWAYRNLISLCSDMEKEYAYAVIYYINMYLRAVIDQIHPVKVILWNEFFYAHHIMKQICAERNIRLFYMEFGSFPGTFSIEHLGQMGKSYPARFSDEFCALEVTDEEIRSAKEMIDFIKERGLNRNNQPVNNNVAVIRKMFSSQRPVILYAGINDYESGVAPYSDEARRWHSPMFKNSEEALFELKRITDIYGYTLIYKPHPLLEDRIRENEKKYEGIIIAKDVNINEIIDTSDVVVTILSQVSYVSLIRNKPVVMLGYTQLKGKGCTYEAFSLEDIDLALSKAVAIGYTREMRNCFEKHAAQMVKYNLYDDLQPRELRYGRTMKEAINYMNLTG